MRKIRADASAWVQDVPLYCRSCTNDLGSILCTEGDPNATASHHQESGVVARCLTSVCNLGYLYSIPELRLSPWQLDRRPTPSLPIPALTASPIHFAKPCKTITPRAMPRGCGYQWFQLAREWKFRKYMLGLLTMSSTRWAADMPRLKFGTRIPSTSELWAAPSFHCSQGPE